MTEKFVGSECERAPDLVAFLYGEATPAEARHFQMHVQSCASCRSDLVAFGGIRESLGWWRLEALGSLAVSPVRSLDESPREELVKPSAVAAIREFFRLSPLWMKGAVAFASLLFCVFAVIVMARLGESVEPSVAVQTPVPFEAADTKDNSGDASDKTKKQVASLPTIAQDQERSAPVNSKRPRSIRSSSRAAPIPQRLQLTREEREELATDLRLIEVNDETDLDLLGDRFNRD